MRLPTVKDSEVCLGAALMVPEPLAGELTAARKSFGDPDKSAPHITVIGPTPVAEEAVEDVIGDLRAEVGMLAPFRVCLRGTATFRPVSPVVYARLEAGLDECLALEAAVRPLVPGLAPQFPYHPHVTIANATSEAALDRAERAFASIHHEFLVRALVVSFLEPGGSCEAAFSLPLHDAVASRSASGAR